MTFSVAVAGASGRLGARVISVLEQIDGVEIVARLGSRSPLSELDVADIVVDVTTPSASPAIVEHVASRGGRVLVGTSGWSLDRIAPVRTAVAEHGAVVRFVPNFSIGSVLGTWFAQAAAAWFDSAEVIEAHHAGKVDSPSGTAVRTAELMSAARGARGPFAAPWSDQRARGEKVAGVPVHSLRLAGIVARQEVRFGGEGEVLSIIHDTMSPSSYDSGIALALAAVRDALPGTVTVGLDDLLGLPPAVA